MHAINTLKRSKCNAYFALNQDIPKLRREQRCACALARLFSHGGVHVWVQLAHLITPLTVAQVIAVSAYPTSALTSLIKR